MKNLIKNLSKNKELILIISVFILGILPLLIISFYNHPSADDYNYSIRTFHAWNSNKSLIDLFGAAWETILNMRQHWHGAYAAVFIMAFQPGIFGSYFYFLSFIFLFLVFAYANFHLCKTIITHYIGRNYKKIFLLCLPIIFLSIQFLPSIVQSFFWWNGAINYTFFYSLSLLLFSIMLRYIKTDDSKKKWIYIILMFILSILIGGGNYSTPLPTMLIMSLFLLYSLLRDRKKAPMIIIAILLMLIGLIVSVKCPGTIIRQNQENAIGLDPINAVIVSLKTSFNYFIDWSRPYMIVIFMYISTIIYRIVDKSKLNFSYKYPLIFTIITFGIASSHFTAPLFAMGYIGDGRLQNLTYFYYIWFFVLNCFYYIGWLKTRLNNKLVIFNHLFTELIKKNKIWLVLVLLFVFSYSIRSSDYSKISSVSATKSLISGEAKLYDDDMNQRIKLYQNKNLKNIEVDELSVRPYVLFFSDISEDENYWANNSLEQFFDKDSIHIKQKLVE